MNEKINLCEILKDCPKGTEFWSDNFGKVKFINVGTEWDACIEVKLSNGLSYYYTKEGWCDKHLPANCMLWPSKDCRDWSKWEYPKHEKPKFDPKTLQPFDKVLVCDKDFTLWSVDFFSFIGNKGFRCTGGYFDSCIPYNDETKHLLGTSDEAPEYYRYLED